MDLIRTKWAEHSDTDPDEKGSW